MTWSTRGAAHVRVIQPGRGIYTGQVIDHQRKKELEKRENFCLRRQVPSDAVRLLPILQMIWTIKTLFFLVLLRWLTRLSAYIVSEGRVYNPDVSRHLTEKNLAENWTLS